MQPDVLNGVLRPEFILVLGEQHERQRDVVEDGLHMALDGLAGLGGLEGGLDELEGGAEGLGAYKVGFFVNEYFEVGVNEGGSVVSLKLVTVVVGNLISLGSRHCPVSIFN